MSGMPAYPGWVVPSMMTDLVMAGSFVAGMMTGCPAPAMSKSISCWPGVALDARIASRKEIIPSGPGLFSSAAIELVSPSTTSLVVVTANGGSGLTATDAVPLTEPTAARIVNAPEEEVVYKPEAPIDPPPESDQVNPGCGDSAAPN